MLKKKTTQVEFALIEIKTEQFAILEENYTAHKKEANFGTLLQYKVYPKDNQIVVYVGFEFFQTKKTFLKLQVSCRFSIETSSWVKFIHQKQSKIIIPKDFLSHLTMITVGTARGILFAKTESTQFSNYILPTINVSEMIVEDAVLDLVKETSGFL